MRPIAVLKSSNGRRNEITVYENRIVVKTRVYFRFWDGMFLLFGSVIILPYLCGFFDNNNMAYLFVPFSLLYVIFLTISILKTYIFDFHSKKVYVGCLSFSLFPILSFSKIGGITKVLEMHSKKEMFFFKLWRKDKKFTLGILMSDVHTDSEYFEARFREYVFARFSGILNFQDELSYDIDDVVKDKPFILRSCFYRDKDKIFYKPSVKMYYKGLFATYFCLIPPGILILSSNFARFIFLIICVLMFFGGPLYPFIGMQNYCLYKDNGNVVLYFRKKNLRIPVSHIIKISTELDGVREFNCVVSICLNEFVRYELDFFNMVDFAAIDSFINGFQVICGREIPIEICEDIYCYFRIASY